MMGTQARGVSDVPSPKETEITRVRGLAKEVRQRAESLEGRLVALMDGLLGAFPREAGTVGTNQRSENVGAIPYIDYETADAVLALNRCHAELDRLQNAL